MDAADLPLRAIDRPVEGSDAPLPSEFTLVLTCPSHPEQYDALLGDRQVAYLRMRDYVFRVECPGIGGAIVYEATPKGDGLFDDDEREHHLAEACKAISAWCREQDVAVALDEARSRGDAVVFGKEKGA
jgi:hypothetical protein